MPPKAAVLLNFKIPALTVVKPVKVLVPERVKVPDPALVKAKVWVVFLSTPEKVVLLLSPTVVKVKVPAPALLSTVPAPAREPMVSFRPFISKVLLAFTVTALPSGMTPEAPNFKVPGFTVVVPE